MNQIVEYVQGLKIPWVEVVGVAWAILLILFVAGLLLIIAMRMLVRLEDHLIRKKAVEGEPPSESAKRVSTLMRLIRQGVLLAVWIVVGLMVLRQLGVDIAPLLAGAGIVGLAVGFGGQALVRDVISGFFIILENQVRVGDVAIVNGTGGLVEKINFRTLVLRDLAGVVHVFPNGTIDTLSNMTDTWSAYVFDLGVAYKEQTDNVIEVVEEVIAGMRAEPKFGVNMLEHEIFGVDKFGDSAVMIKGRIKTRPIQQWMVGREFLRRVKIAFDERGIEIPFPHRTVYWGQASQPFQHALLAGGGLSEDLARRREGA